MATYYVSTTGSDSNPGTLAQPWRTIQHSMNAGVVAPGDTINIRGGTVYNERLVLGVSGTAGNPITYQSYGFVGSDSVGGYTGVALPGENATLDYGYLGTNTSTTPLFQISGRSYVNFLGITFQNFACTGAMQQGIRIDGSSTQINFKWCRMINFQNTYAAGSDGTTALLATRVWGPSTYVNFYACEFWVQKTNASEALTYDSSASYGTVEKCWLHECDGIALDSHSSAHHNLFRDNHFNWCGGRRPDGTYWYGRHGVTLYNDGGHDNIFDGNFVADGAIGIQNLAETTVPAVYNMIIRNNVVTRMANAGLLIGTWYSSTDGSTVYNQDWYNNTVYSCSIGIQIRPFDAATSRIRNNIVSGCTTAYSNGLAWNVGSSFDYNLYYGGGSGGPDVHKITTNPLFVDPANVNFALQSGSPAINAGDPTTTTTQAGSEDFIRHARFAGNIDIGAYEYASTVLMFDALLAIYSRYNTTDGSSSVQNCFGATGTKVDTTGSPGAMGVPLVGTLTSSAGVVGGEDGSGASGILPLANTQTDAQHNPFTSMMAGSLKAGSSGGDITLGGANTAATYFNSAAAEIRAAGSALPPPAITDVSPDTVTADGGPTISVNGSNFGSGSNVLLISGDGAIPTTTSYVPGGTGVLTLPLSTNGTQIVDAAGNVIRLTGLVWRGFEAADHIVHGLWARSCTGMLDQIVNLGYNVIRLPWSDKLLDPASTVTGISTILNPDFAGLTPLQALDLFISYCAARELMVILEHHRMLDTADPSNGLWYGDGYTEAQVIADWETLADRYKNEEWVVGCDLHNEPWAATWDASGDSLDWQQGATRLGNAILAKNPNVLILIEGTKFYPDNYAGDTAYAQAGANLTGVHDDPVTLNVANKVVYSPHDFPITVTGGGGTVDTTQLFPDQTRVTTWSPGIDGGSIPSRTTIYATADAATYGNGSTDATTYLQNLINNCPEGQVIYLPAGTYKISSRLVVSKGIVIRGEGNNSVTQIRGLGMAAYTECIRIGPSSPTWPSAVNVTASIAKGDKTIQVASTTGLSVGSIIQLDMDDPTYVHTALTYFVRPEYGPATPGGLYRHVGQTCEVVDIVGTTLTLRDPIHLDYPLAQTPQIYWTNQTPVQYAGIEDLTVTGGAYGQIWLLHCARCWVKGVESDGTVTSGATGGNEVGNGNGNTNGAHIWLAGAYRCVVRACYIHHATSIEPGGGAYGLTMIRHSSENLFENNISYWLNKPFTMRASGGGNVIAYNYFENAFINSSPAWQENTLDAGHGAFSHMELFEGNYAAQAATEGVWGNSAWVTFYRNRFTGQQKRSLTYETQDMICVHLEWNSHYINVVGNILGKTGIVSSDGKSQVYELTSNTPYGIGQPCVYRLGCGYGTAGGGSGDEASFEDPDLPGSVKSRLYRHGNFDYVNNAIQWDGTNPYHTLGNSLYLTSRPGFFPATYTWPWVEPTTSMTYVLPAKARFDAGVPNEYTYDGAESGGGGASGALPAVWDFYWGWILNQGVAPVLLGSFGAALSTEEEQSWFSSICSYAGNRDMSFTWWAWNPNNPPQGGLLQDDWTTIVQAKQDGLAAIQAAPLTAGPPRLTFPAPPHAAGVVDVRVTNPDGQFATLLDALTYSATEPETGGGGVTPPTPIGERAATVTTARAPLQRARSLYRLQASSDPVVNRFQDQILGTLNPALATLGQMPTVEDGVFNAETWTDFSLMEPWAAATATTPGFYMDATGRVNLRGVVAGGALGNTAAVLPLGYRPSYEMTLPTTYGASRGAVTITPKGYITPADGDPALGVSLDGLSFRAEQ